MGMESTRMETFQLDAVMTEFAALTAWMRNEGINRLFVGDYCCDWSNIDGSRFVCEIPQSPEIIMKAWEKAQNPLRSASQAILKRQYPQNEDDWDYTFLDSMEFTIDHNRWHILTRVWFQTDVETLGDLGRKELVTTEGHVNWVARPGQAWETDIKAATHVEPVVFGSLQGSIDPVEIT